MEEEDLLHQPIHHNPTDVFLKDELDKSLEEV